MHHRRFRLNSAHIKTQEEKFTNLQMLSIKISQYEIAWEKPALPPNWLNNQTINSMKHVDSTVQQLVKNFVGLEGLLSYSQQFASGPCSKSN